ncbi:MAG: alcohol dehydrogenase catalytic domain-containing protein [Janthinobacterium lividum]
MKGLVYHGAADIRYENTPDPVPGGADEVLVKTKRCSICGSDLHIYHGAMTLGRPNFCIGHEAIGEVVEAGRDVKNLKVGDQVMLPGSVGCGACRFCVTGLVNKCERKGLRVYGLGLELGGCQAEAIAVPAADFNALRIPEGITDDQALILTDSLPTAYLGCTNAEIGPGKTVAIVGLGPIGLMAVEAAFVLGASRVFAIDLLPERRALAAALGAEALDPAQAVEVVREATHARMLDCAVEVVGAAVTVDLAIQLVGQQSNVSVIGANLDRFDFPIRTALRKGLTFRVSICSVQHRLPELVALVQNGRLHPERFITHRMKLSEGAHAYDIFNRRADGAMKIVLEP